MFVTCIRCNKLMDITMTTIHEDYDIYINYRCEGCGTKVTVSLDTVTDKIIREGVKRL